MAIHPSLRWKTSILSPQLCTQLRGKRFGHKLYMKAISTSGKETTQKALSEEFLKRERNLSFVPSVTCINIPEVLHEADHCRDGEGLHAPRRPLSYIRIARHRKQSGNMRD